LIGAAVIAVSLLAARFDSVSSRRRISRAHSTLLARPVSRDPLAAVKHHPLACMDRSVEDTLARLLDYLGAKKAA
jgi:hypothetical protein